MTALEPYVGPTGEPEKSATGKYRQFMDQTRLPQPSRAVPVAKRVVAEDAVKWAWLGVQLPLIALRELKPICLGISKMAGAWHSWINCEKAEESIKLLESPSSRLVEQVVKTRKANRRISLAVSLLLLAGGTVAAFTQPAVLGLAGFTFVAIADLVGRKDKPAEPKAPPPHRMVVTEGTSFAEITKQLFEVIAPREGLDLGQASPMTFDPIKKQYEIKVTCLDEIKPEHIRAFERGLGFVPFAVRRLHDEGDPATMHRLVMRIGDPLNEVVPSPWLPTGSVSVSDPLDVGVSLTEVPFWLYFAGEHMRVIGATGSGKSSWFLRNCIDRVSACHNAVALGIDLSNGPELALWRDVIQRKATTPEQVEALLDEVLKEIDRRSAILTRYAEDDDPANDHLTEWCDELAEKEGPAWVIFADEYALAAQLSPEILERFQRIVRTGRKVWISLVMLAQKTGNTDFGSTVMSTQCNTTVGLPCSAKDAVDLFGKTKRDAGFDPSILQPGTKQERRDAGKCFVESPLHTTPDIYSCYAPLSAGDVKNRARRRMADGLPSMYIGEVAEERDIQDGIVIPPVWAELEGLFARHGEKLPTETILTHLRMIDPAVYGKWTGNDLATAVAPHLRPKKNLNIAPGNNPKGYVRSEFIEALRTLTGEG